MTTLEIVLQALNEAAEQDPELATYYGLHRELFELQENAKAETVATLELADPMALQARARQGLPSLAFAQLPIEPQRFTDLALAITQALTSYYTDLEGQELPSDPIEWVALAERRFAEKPTEQNDEAPSATLAEMSAEQALKPYLAWAAEQILPHLDQELWKQGYCPVCGGTGNPARRMPCVTGPFGNRCHRYLRPP